MAEDSGQDFELVDDAERKSSTSESFENLDQKEPSEASSEEQEEEDTLKFGKNQEEEEEKPQLPFVDQSIKDDAERPKEKDGEELVEEALNMPIRRDQEQFYTAEDGRRAITLLILFSAMMFTLPLLVMFSLYHWVFIDHYHLPPDQAILYSGICAAGVVIIICALFAYIAWKEEKDAEEKLKKENKKDQ